MPPMPAWFEVAPGVRLHALCWPGQPAPGRVPFLLVHGLSSNARLWLEVAGDLAGAGHPVTAVDLRSHGDSDAPPHGYDTATAVADLATLGLGRTLVAGQSWGGNIAVALAAKHPDLVAGLALVDGGWIDLPSQYPDWAACAAALRPPDLDGLTAAKFWPVLRASHPSWSEQAVAATAANLRELPDGTLQRRLPVPAHMRIVRSMWDDPPGRYYPLVTAPALLLPALSTDPAQAAAKLARVRAAAAALPDAQLRSYPGADHDLHAQYPHEIAGDLLGLAARVA